MKAFCTALIIFIFLVSSVIILSSMGSARISEYKNSIPAEDAGLTEAEEALSTLSAQIEDERLLLALLFSHERCDELESAIARCAAAAHAEEFPEYAILRAELIGLIEAMERDLRPGVLDVL